LTTCEHCGHDIIDGTTHVFDKKRFDTFKIEGCVISRGGHISGYTTKPKPRPTPEAKQE